MQVRPEDQEEEEKLRSENRMLIYRQTIMFSATMPLKVELLAKKFLRNPVFLAIGDRSGTFIAYSIYNILYLILILSFCSLSFSLSLS